MTTPVKTLRDVLEAGTAHLTALNIENPRLACELLASRLLRCRRLDLYLKFELVLSEKQLDAMRRGVRRVAAGEPVQYVCGEWAFRGHTFKVDRRALIPRPETEGLVEKVLECAPLWQVERPLILDIGTGSGCIAISLAIERPQAICMAFDVSEEALALARENADALGASNRVLFQIGEVSDLVEPSSLDAVVANLPYIPTRAYERLPVQIRTFEPRLALDGGEDGLVFIRSAVQDSSFMLKPDGHLFLEIGEDQAEAVCALCEEAGFADIRIDKDLAERNRIVSGRLAI